MYNFTPGAGRSGTGYHCMRLLAIILYFLAIPLARVNAQGLPADSATPLSSSETFGLPLARAQVFDAAMLAWQRSFGREPHAELLLQDRANGTLEGQGRINYRSTQLIGREESMGVISYRVIVQASNGSCTVQVTNLRHSGNRAAQRGGLNMGVLLNGAPPAGKVPGYSHRNIKQLHADMRERATERIKSLMNSFGATLRAAPGP